MKLITTLSTYTVHLSWLMIKRYLLLLFSFLMVMNGKIYAQIDNPTKNDTLFYDQNGNVLANPGDSLEYIVIIRNPGMSNADTLTVNIHSDPNTSLNPNSIITSAVASNDGLYMVTGNVAISIDSANGLLTNDFDDCISCLTLSAGMTSTSQGGSINISGDGSFIYDPPPGYTGLDTATYYVVDNTPVPNWPDTNYAQIVFSISQTIWFIDNQAMGSSNLGTFLNPFTTIAAFNASAGPGINHYISLAAGTYTESDGINLQNGQILIGEGVQLNMFFTAEINSVPAFFTFASSSGTRPTIISTGGMNHGIDLASGNSIRGLNIGNTTGYGMNGGVVGNLLVDQVSITGNGGAIKVATSGSFSTNVNFDELSSTNSFQDAICLINVSGSLGLSSGAISQPTRNAVQVNGNNVSFTYTGAISKSTGLGNMGISISNHSGNISFMGVVDIGTSGSRLTATGVNLLNNTAIYVFANLDIFTNNATGLFSSASGTVNVTTGTVNSSNAGAVDIDNTVLGINLVSVTSDGGGSPGIDLNTTTGSFTVAGDGMTLRNTSGGIIQNKTVDAIVLTNAINVTLTSMLVQNNMMDGIQSSGGSSITLSALEMRNPTGNGWIATNLTGNNYVNNDCFFTLINSANTSAIRVQNTNTNLTLFEINNSDFMNSSSGQSNVLFETFGTSNARFDVINGCIFEDLTAQAVSALSGQSGGSTGTMTTNILNCFFQNAKGMTGECNLGVLVANGATQDATITSNTFTQVGKDGSIANTSILRTQNAGGTWRGTISQNNLSNFSFNIGGRHGIGYVGESAMATAITDLVIDNNMINDLTDREGIFISTRSNLGSTNITVSNNTIGTMGNIGGGGPNSDQPGIEIECRNDMGSAYTSNVRVHTNTVTTTDNGSAEVLFVEIQDDVTGNVTINGNTLNSTTSGDNRIEVESDDAGTIVCANIFMNNLNAPDVNKDLIELQVDGTFNVTQTSLANLASVNSVAIGNIAESGTSPPPTYGGAVCTLPTHN